MNCKCFLPVFIFICLAWNGICAQHIPTPKEHFGFAIGDDYMLANYTQAEAYYKKVAAASDRVLLREIGKTEEGRTQYLIIISSPENIKHIDRYQQISQKLARAEDITDDEATQLAKEGKAVVWIDGGLHANETVGSHQLIEMCYQLASRNDPETKEILDKVIILLSQVNPDGQEIVANWYMKDKDVTKRNMNIPRLYQKYIGHDNNRDFYMMNMKETENIARQFYLEWMPQIIYNHHQTAPAGAVVAGPPYRDPFNFVYDPLLVTSLDAVAASMINRLNAEDKPGFTRLSGSVYSTWWNGGLRTAAYFHNMIGLLTEITGNPTPSEISLVPDRLTPNMATPYPVTPQKWKFRNSIDYSVSLNYGVLDYARRHYDELLYNIYRMGKNAIDKGSRDSWTLMPKYIDSVRSVIARNQKNMPAESSRQGMRTSVSAVYFDSVFRSPAYRDPRGYIIPADQRDFPTAVKFINALIKSGIRVERATAPFTIEGKTYPSGSYIVKTNQAFRPHVMDMFEPQDHPNDFQYPGGPPVRPYDAAGWTLAYQMGVQFYRILNAFEGPFEKVPYGELQSPPVKNIAMSQGYILSAAVNNSFIAVNDLLRSGVDVFRLTKDEDGMKAGPFYVTAKGYEVLKKAGSELGVNAKPVSKKPVALTRLSQARIALYDQYGGSIPSGWVRWLLEQYHFPFSVIYPQEIDKGALHNRYDVILFIDAGMPRGGRPFVSGQPKPEDIPEEYRNRLGSITKEKTIPQLKLFLQNGGSIVTIGSSTILAYLLDMPVKNALSRLTSDGKLSPLSSNDFYIPGSILKAEIDNNQPENWGMGTASDMVFDNSPLFSLNPDAVKKGVRPLAWFGDYAALRSGWAWGQSYLKEGVVAFAAPVGKGRFFACGTEITFRAQSHNTFKMLFNQLYQLQQ